MYMFFIFINIDIIDENGSIYKSATCFYTNSTASGAKDLKNLDYPSVDYCKYNCADEGFKYAMYNAEQDKNG